VTRKQRGSCNRRKAAQRLATLHRRIAHQRANTIHQLTRRLANTKSAAVIEDLNVSGMLKKPSAGAVHWRLGLGRVPAAGEVHGGVVWMPGARRQSMGAVGEDLTPADRVFRCQNAGCGLALDRDLNAARILATLAGSSSERRNACGEESAGYGLADVVNLSP